MNKLEQIKRNYNNSVDGEREEYYQQFLNEVFRAVNEGEWICFPCKQDDKGTQVIFVNKDNRLYVAAYAIKEKFIAKDLALFDINKVIDLIYASGNISGIIFDPNNDPIVVEREFINSQTDRKDPRLQKVDWGKGIPIYSPNDLLTNIEVFDFAMEIMETYLIKDGFTLLDKLGIPGVVNNFEVEKNGKKYFVLVRECLYDNKRELSAEEKANCKKIGQEHGYIPTVAYLSIGSSDRERFNKKLALYGDGYICNFSGLEEIK